jgi:hypothetical protein
MRQAFSGGRPVTPTNDEYTPEQLAAILAEHKKKFTADDLFGYIEDDAPTIPARQVLDEMKEIVRELKQQKGEATS